MRKRKPIVEKINWKESTDWEESREEDKHIEHMKREMKRIGQEYIPEVKLTEEEEIREFEQRERELEEEREEPTDDEANIMRQLGAGGMD
jgi:hypothetical protein